MEIDSLVWVKPSPDGDWSKAKIRNISHTDKTDKSKRLITEFTVQLQDVEGNNVGSDNLSIPTVLTDGSTFEYDSVKLRNQINEHESDNIEDLIVLNYLHEPAILWTLQSRFNKDLIYANTGPILIALNPFKNLAMYSAENVNKYRSAGETNAVNLDAEVQTSPHVFKIADASYRNMTKALMSRQSQCNQSILVSGESGAGKTETTKFIMRYLADITREQTAHLSDDAAELGELGVENLVLQSNPILESFGNARTLRNDNSSRFGKFIEINFSTKKNSTNPLINGATIRTYLLEKVRLVYQGKGERNYHCFYEYLRGCNAEELDQRGLTDVEDYAYLNQSGCTERQDDVDDATQFDIVKGAMNDLEFSSEEQSFVADIVASVLHIGNISFEEDGDHGCRVTAGSSQKHVDHVCRMLGVSDVDLRKALCEKFVVTKDDSFVRRYSVAEADQCRDALAKTIFGATFDWLVLRVNGSISAKSVMLLQKIDELNRKLDDRTNSLTKETSVSKAGDSVANHQKRRAATTRRVSTASVQSFIGVLDIFGFENFISNSFEQLCINYTNETLQQHFNLFVFEHEQEVYRKEEINWSFVSFPDNKDTLDLLENKKQGIFSICDDQARFQWSTHLTLVNRLYESYANKHPKFFVGSYEKARNLFIVRHYAGSVCYDSSQFLEKNNDLVSPDLLRLIHSSSRELLVGLMDFLRSDEDSSSSSSSSSSDALGGDRVSKGAASASNKGVTLGFEFRRQLKELMSNISTTTPHYIRCIKPNSKNVANLFDQTLVLSQLKCCGVIEAVRVSRAGFPNKFKYRDFYERYFCLCLHHRGGMNGDGSSSLLRRKGTKDVDRVLIDKLGAFLADKVLLNPVYKPIHGDDGEGDSLVKAGMQIGRTLVFLRRGSFDLLEQMRFVLQRRSVIKIQAQFRRYSKFRQYMRMRLATLRVQCAVRIMRAKMAKRRIVEHNATILLQKRFLGYVARKLVKYHMRCIVRLQSMFRRKKGMRIVHVVRQVHRQTLIARTFRRYWHTKMFNKLRSSLIVLQTRARIKSARKQLAALKLDAKNLNKVAAERDAMAAKLLEWERKWAELEKQQQQQQQQAAGTSADSLSTTNLATAAAAPPPTTPLHSTAPPNSTATTPLPDVHQVAPFTPTPIPTGVAEARPHTPLVIEKVPDDYELIKAELEATKKALEEAKAAKERDAAAAAAAAASSPSSSSSSSPMKSRQQRSSVVASGDRTELMKRTHSQPHMARKSSGPPAVLFADAESTVRDLKINEKLKSTELELQAYKEKIQKLEEENKNLQLGKKGNSPAATAIATTEVPGAASAAQGTAAAVTLDYGGDSDDSDGGEDVHEDLHENIKDLDNRQSDWKAYMGDFDTGEATPRRLSMHGQEDVEYDSDGNEILNPNRVTRQHSRSADSSGLGDGLTATVTAATAAAAAAAAAVQASTLPPTSPTRAMDFAIDADDSGEDQEARSDDSEARLRRHAAEERQRHWDDSDSDDSETTSVHKFNGNADVDGSPQAQSLSRKQQYNKRLSAAWAEDSDEEKQQQKQQAAKEAVAVDHLNSMLDDKRRRSLDTSAAAAVSHEVVSTKDPHGYDALGFGGGDRGSGGGLDDDGELSTMSPLRSAAVLAPIIENGGIVDNVKNPYFATPSKRPSKSRELVGAYTNPLPSSEKKNVRRISRHSEDGSIASSWQEDCTLLLQATAQKDLDSIDRILTTHPKAAKSVDYKGQTALHLACQIGSIELVECLTGYNINVDTQDNTGKTALHFCRNPEIVCLLCDEGANPNLADNNGMTPLHEYVQAENVDCTRAIVAYGGDPTVQEPHFQRNSIHVAADIGNYELLTILVLESQVVVAVDQTDCDGMTALHLAATCDREEGVQHKIFMLLLEKGANPVMNNDRGITPMHLICANRALSRLGIAEPIAEMLINLGADPNCQDVDGCTPLIVACAYREWSLCRLLLDTGGDLNVPCSMTSIFLQAGDMRISFSKDKQDIKTSKLISDLDCTASDLMPRTPRYLLFGHISVPQTRISGATRDRCMNCAASFSDNSSMFSFSSGKHHCRHCLRVVCQKCSPHEVHRSKMPGFIQETCNESNMRMCVVCYTVLIEKKEVAPLSTDGADPTGTGSGSWF